LSLSFIFTRAITVPDNAFSGTGAVRIKLIVCSLSRSSGFCNTSSAYLFPSFLSLTSKAKY
uniref:Uncharacterized protein n=1 Tax=Anolis carolinensis TaxID=28377 RepID=A0A803TXX1_ANOCA